MDDERRRILGMLKDGSISVEECEELLRAMKSRRTEKVKQDVQAVQGRRPVWPYILLVVVAAATVPMWLDAWVGGLLLPRLFVSALLPVPFFMFGGLAFAFWIWMLVDCLSRLPSDFRLLFTSRHEYDKWIWIAVVALVNWVGALIYFIIIRQHARGADRETMTTPPSPEQPFTPSPRARSIILFFVMGLLLALLASGSALLFDCYPWATAVRTAVSTDFQVHSGTVRGALPLAPALLLPVFVMAIAWLTIFWLWMLIDCLARDHREFGTLIASDTSGDKLLWLLLILFTFVIGALAYHISIRRRPRPEPAAHED